jgi:hypothetical protein
MRAVGKVAGIAIHLLLIAAAVVAVLVWTSHLASPPGVRAAVVILVAVLSMVTVFGRLPLGLGPAARSVAAWIVRLVAMVLAGIGVAEWVLGLVGGGSPSDPHSGGFPMATVVLAVYLAAFLAVTRRDGGLPPRALLTGLGLGLLAAGLFAGAVPLLWPELVWWVGFLLIAAAAVASGWLIRPVEAGVQAAVLATLTGCQAVFFAAVVLYYDAPDAWMPYAGPGPLTVQGQLEQNRAEAIDPYVALLFLGAVAATGVTVQAVTAWRRSRAGASPARGHGLREPRNASGLDMP